MLLGSMVKPSLCSMAMEKINKEVELELINITNAMLALERSEDTAIWSVTVDNLNEEGSSWREPP